MEKVSYITLKYADELFSDSFVYNCISVNFCVYSNLKYCSLWSYSFHATKYSRFLDIKLPWKKFLLLVFSTMYTFESNSYLSWVLLTDIKNKMALRHFIKYIKVPAW